MNRMRIRTYLKVCISNTEKEIIDTFVNSVFVYEDKLVLTYNYKDGSETLTLQEIEAVLSSNLTRFSICRMLIALLTQ